ncbi:hypothetical protein [Spiroplasma attinicola]|uniref:hypothetical protein n=1 Tax=Spiroplasma attinicola TaxID=2904537 RepID=UPI002022A35D|nr:hypothetical protein [Spiroplasma sp. JKS002670]MCL8209957.1 hypothetical protein [Spiroplasma sp. JKS002670]
MNDFINFYYQKVRQLKWLFSFVLGFFLILFTVIGLVLTPFGLYNQTLIYQKNWNQALEKYVAKEKYQLNQNYPDYNEVVLEQLTNVFNKNAENILTGLIANKLAINSEQAVAEKNHELETLDNKLIAIYGSNIDLWAIINDYNIQLFNIIKKYTDFSFNNSSWKSNGKSISNLIAPDYKNKSLYKVELNYLISGDEIYNWIDNEGNQIYFQGLQYYEYYTYTNYLTILDAFISGSIATANPILLGNWSINDLSYIQFLKAKIINENFYYPMYFKAFMIERIADIILLIVLPIQLILTIFLLIFIWQSQLLWNSYQKHSINIMYKNRYFSNL